MARADATLLQRDDPESPLRLRVAQDGAYRPGAEGDAATPLAARIEPESALHSLLDRDAEVAVEQAMTAVDVTRVLRECVAERGPRPSRVNFVVRSRHCRDCGNGYPSHRDACPVCGSTAWAIPPGQKSLFS
jgi:hypothetical protein